MKLSEIRTSIQASQFGFFSLLLSATVLLALIGMPATFAQAQQRTAPRPTAAAAAAGEVIGHLDAVSQSVFGQIQIAGWAADPRTPNTALQLRAYVTGPNGVQSFAGNYTGQVRGDVASSLGWPSSKTGFKADLPTGGTGYGSNSVCVYAISIAAPLTNPSLGCLGLTTALPAPKGNVESITVNGASAVVNGWTFDPNRRDVSNQVHVYVNNGGAAFVADHPRPDVNSVFAIAGLHGFSETVALGAGSNTIFIYGIGENNNNSVIGARAGIYVAPPSSPTVTYRSANFDNLAIGAVNPTDFNAALGATNKNLSAYDDMTVAADSRGSGNVIRTILKAGTIHSSNGGDSGDNLFISLPASYDKACMQYDIKFDASFDWSLGGKLPGLEGVAPGVSPAAPTGGNYTDVGWSGRGMWLGPEAYSWAGPTNMAVSYMYHPGQAGTYGDNVRWNKAYLAGTWHTVKQCHVMNTVGQANGVLKAWMDGALVVNNNAYTYRTSNQVHINYIVFSLFRGGNTANWAGSRDNFVDIDNVLITES